MCFWNKSEFSANCLYEVFYFHFPVLLRKKKKTNPFGKQKESNYKPITENIICSISQELLEVGIFFFPWMEKDE